MTLYEFDLMPYARQLAHVFDGGTFLAHRWKEEQAGFAWGTRQGRLRKQ